MEELSSKQLAVNDSVVEIEQADIKEREAIAAWREATDPDEKDSCKEDAYLQHLIMISNSRLMGKESFDAEKLEAVVNCKYEELTLVDFENYKIS